MNNIVKNYKKYNLYDNLKIIHFNGKSKILNYIEDNNGKYMNDEKKNNPILYKIIYDYKKDYYTEINDIVTQINTL